MGQSTCCGCSAARSPSASSLVTHSIRSSVQWLATPPLHSRARHFRDRKIFLHNSDFCDIHVVTRIFTLKILAIHLLSATSVWQFFLLFSKKLLLHCQKYGTENPSVDFRIPDENFAMQNSRLAFTPHPCGAFIHYDLHQQHFWIRSAILHSRRCSRQTRKNQTPH